MTPQELHTAVDERRRQSGLPWWRIEIQIKTTYDQLRLMRHGRITGPLRERVERWLEAR